MEKLGDSNWTRWNTVVFQAKFHQFWFEKVDIDSWYDFAETFMFPLIILTVSVYLVAVVWLKSYMKDKEPLNLRTQLFLWNVVVTLFSAVALQRVGSEVFAIWNAPEGFYKSVCLRDGLHLSTAYWGVVIVWSKPFFAVDTAFLILRKKHIDAVHIIHHTVAIIFAPIMTELGEPVLRWLGLANLLVHAIDYPLLALRALRIRVAHARQIMAALEILQMIFVLIILAYTLILKVSGASCLRHPTSIKLTYTTYLGLLSFVIFTILSPEYWKRGRKPASENYVLNNNKEKIK